MIFGAKKVSRLHKKSIRELKWSEDEEMKFFKTLMSNDPKMGSFIKHV